MANQSQGTARFLLTVFRDQGFRAGHALPKGRLYGAVFASPFGTAFLDEGLNIAVNEGWLDVFDGDMYRLTDKGEAFAATL